MTARVSLDLSPAADDLAFRLGRRLLAEPPVAGLFHILYSDASGIWSAQTWREVPADAVSARATAGRLSLRVASFGGLPIELRAEAEVAADRPEVVWRMTVRNRAPGVVVGVGGPALAGIETRPGGALFIPNRPGQRLAEPWQALAAAPARIVYPVPASMQFVTYAGQRGGVALHVLDRAMVYKELVFGGPARVLDVVQYPFIAPGGSWRSPEVVWQALAGDWHDAADRYRAWFASWAEKPRVSRQVLGFPIMGGTVIKARPLDDPNIRDVQKRQEVGTYAAALEQARALKAGGFDGTHLVGWFGRGHDTTYPDFDPAADMGGPEGLKALITGMHSMGMIATLYLNARLANVASPTYLAHQDWRAKLPNGAVWREQYGDQVFTALCPACEGFRRHLTAEVVRVARDWRGDGVQLDQVGAASALLCFDRSHGHATPATAWAEGYDRMLRQVRAAARAVNPDFWFWIEGAWEGAGRLVDASQGGFWQDIPGCTYFPQLYRYTLPDHPLFGDPSMGGVPFWCRTDIGRAARINAAAGDVFLRGRFLDDIGLVTEPPARAHWFVEGRRAAVTVSNDADTPRVFTVRVRLAAAGTGRPAPKRGRALAAGLPVEVAAERGAISFSVEVPPRQVEAVLLEP